MKKLLFIFLIIPFFAGAVEILPIPQKEGFFAKLLRCNIRISCWREPVLGVSLTTITGSTLISDLDTVLTDNFNALNNGKIENSTTSVAAITTLSNLVTVGALSSGSLASGFTTITVPLGGTGSTTLSSNSVLLGNGTGAIKTVSGLGSNGNFLQSTGAGSAPIWASSAVDTSASYVWTGMHTFSLGATTSASTTIDRLFARFSTTTQATTTNITVTGHASTSLLTTSLNCTSCPGAYTGSSTVILVTSGTVTHTGAIPGNATHGQGFYSMSGGNSQNFFILSRSGLTTYAIVYEGGDDTYTVTWSGNDFSVTEDADTGADSQFSATIYWYR